MIWLVFLWLLDVVSGAPARYGREIEEPRFLISKHPFTGQLYYTDLAKIKSPSPIRRLRISFAGKTHVAGSNTILTAFHLRARWVPPEHWFDGFNETDRKYNLVCIAEDVDTMHVQEFLNLKINGEQLTGYEENFLIKDSMRLMIRCRIRAQNSSGYLSKWLASERLFLHT